MWWLGVVHDRCSAAVLACLLKNDHITGVRLAGEEGRAAWDAVGGPVATALAGLPVSVGRPSGDGNPPPAVIDIATGGTHCADPILWALLNRLPRLGITMLDPDGALLGCGEVSVPAGAGYQDVAEAVAAGVAPWLAADPVRPATTARPPTPGPPLPVAKGWARIEWAGSAEEIAATVRAFTPPETGAWTWLDGVRLVVRDARPIGDTRLNVPPGTVVHSGPEGITTVTGHGLLLLGEVFDVIGPVDPMTVAVGVRLGRDLADAVEELSRRVADLECLVRHLAQDV